MKGSRRGNGRLMARKGTARERVSGPPVRCDRCPRGERPDERPQRVGQPEYLPVGHGGADQGVQRPPERSALRGQPSQQMPIDGHDLCTPCWYSHSACAPGGAAEPAAQASEFAGGSNYAGNLAAATHHHPGRHRELLGAPSNRPVAVLGAAILAAAQTPSAGSRADVAQSPRRTLATAAAAIGVTAVSRECECPGPRHRAQGGKPGTTATTADDEQVKAGDGCSAFPRGRRPGMATAA